MKQNSTQEILISTDVVDLTIQPSGSVRVSLPSLTKLLNDNLHSGRGKLENSSIALTNPKGETLRWSNPYFDTNSIDSILHYAIKVTKVELEMSSSNPEGNYVYAYYTEVQSNNEEMNIIGRINWTWDNMSSYWTKNIEFEFKLNF